MVNKFWKLATFIVSRCREVRNQNFWQKFKCSSIFFFFFFFFFWLLPNFLIPRLGMVKNLKFAPTNSVQIKILKILIFIVPRCRVVRAQNLKPLSILTCIIKWFTGFHIGQNLNFWPTISTRLKILKIDVFYQLQVQSSQISEFWPKIQTLLKFYWLLPNFMIPKLAMVKNLKFGDIISRWLTILKNAIIYCYQVVVPTGQVLTEQVPGTM